MRSAARSCPPRPARTRASDLQIRFTRQAHHHGYFTADVNPAWSDHHSSPVASMTTTLNPIIGGGLYVPACTLRKKPFYPPHHHSAVTIYYTHRSTTLSEFGFITLLKYNIYLYSCVAYICKYVGMLPIIYLL